MESAVRPARVRTRGRPHAPRFTAKLVRKRARLASAVCAARADRFGGERVAGRTNRVLDTYTRAHTRTRAAASDKAPTPRGSRCPLHASPARSPARSQRSRSRRVEGCVRETWGALEALAQARDTADPQLRKTMDRIAQDETATPRSPTISRAGDSKPAPHARASGPRCRRERARHPAGQKRAAGPAQLGLPDAGTARRLAEGCARRCGRDAHASAR